MMIASLHSIRNCYFSLESGITAQKSHDSFISSVSAPVGRAIIVKSRDSKSKPFSKTFTARATEVATISPKRFEIIDDCYVFIPPSNSPPRAIVGFLGGAFFGATPDISYQYFIELLSNEGLLVIAIPYGVTFDHLNCVKEIEAKLSATIKDLLDRGIPSVGISGSSLSSVPIVGVGHSNGALMHAMLGSTHREGSVTTANVLISYNNKPASEAIPNFDQVGPVLSQAIPAIQSFPLTGIALSLAEQAVEEFSRATRDLPPAIRNIGTESVSRFAEQLFPVTEQIGSGISEFIPSPSENRRLISSSYATPRTLLVQFDTDSLDETDTIHEILKIRTRETGGAVELVKLRGTHSTPLSPDLKWEAGEAFSPVDALGQFARTAALEDIRRLAKTISDWL